MGEVATSRCNHVFHKRCLTGLAGSDCPKCGQASVAERSVDLFGASFGEDSCSSVGFAIQRVLEERKAAGDGVTRIDLDSEDEPEESIVPGSEHLIQREIVELITMRQDMENKKREYEETVQLSSAACEAEVLQAQKLDKIERSVSKRAKQCASLRKQIEDTQGRIKQLQEDVQIRRTRDAVREYYDIMRKKTSAEALSYLTTIVKLAQDPAPLLVEVARLKEHHRGVLHRKRREIAAENQTQASIRSDLEEKRKQVVSCKRKLGLSRTSPSPPAARTSTSPARNLVKRLRSFGA